ncbi:MAG: hypothetical protein J6Q54_08665 [Oscillospiraceae bacterium]|nr:hypothetical protein [Oscillospiraceae bacterium]
MITVNSNTRQFNIPGADLVFGVVADSDAERKYFQCPRYVGDNLDLAACFIRINYRNANGKTDFYLVDDMVIDGDNITFSWVLSPKVTEYRGQIKFVMCAVGPDLKLKWHTTQGTGQVLDGLEPDNSHVESQTADVVAQLIAMVEEQTSAVEMVGEEQVVAVNAAAETARMAAVNEIEAKGVNTRNSIPEDYTALSSTVESLIRGKAGGIVCSAEGEVITLNDASNQAFRGMRIFGKSTQNGTPTPESPVEIVSIENPTISVDEQTLSTAVTLRGIPVASGGNYTDANGQQWLCDEVDLARGMYVSRHLKYTPNANTGNIQRQANYDGEGYYGWCVYDGNLRVCDNSRNNAPGLATKFLPANHTATQAVNQFRMWANQSALYFTLDTDNVETALEIITSTEFLLALATPIETPLSETELAAYRALHTNKPNTTILNDSGAYMSVDYTADTKLYIDNKIKEALL